MQVLLADNVHAIRRRTSMSVTDLNACVEGYRKAKISIPVIRCRIESVKLNFFSNVVELRGAMIQMV